MTEHVFHVEDRFRSKLLLPEEFWQARPVLARIREAARKRQAPPDLALGATLARLAVVIDPLLRIPPPPGFHAPLGLFVCGAAPASGGKTTAMQVARELLPHQSPRCALDMLPASGEALLELFWSDEEDENGRSMRVRSVDSALISIDEGTLLKSLGERSGNSLVPTLLTMWSGAAAGTDTLASIKKGGVRRRLAADSYMMSMVVALQPRKASDLMAQSDSGFAQRFLWFSDKDPGLPRERPTSDRIEPLDIHPPRAGMDREPAGHPGLRVVRRAEAISDHLWEAGWRKRQVDYEADEMEGHDLLNRTKVAHLLAVLTEERLDIDEEDWRLSGMVSDVSAANRTAVQGVVGGLEEGRRKARQEEQIDTALRMDLKREQVFKLRCREAVVRMLWDAGGRCAIGKRSVTSNHKPYLGEVLRDMVDDEVIGRDGTDYYLL